MGKIRTALFGGAAAIALATTAALGVAPAASAFQGDSCPSSFLCIWKDGNWYTDQMPNSYVKFQRYIPCYCDWNYERTSINSNDTATSIRNSGVSETAYMYRDSNKGYQLFSIPKGNVNGALWGSQGDSISSGYYASYN